jgi:hypothetical protein
MTKDEALRLALEALELHGKQYPHMVKGYCIDAITAIKAALEAKDEPVGTVKELFTQAAWERLDLKGSTEVYTAPPQRTWEKFCDSNCVWTDHHPDCKLAQLEPVAWEQFYPEMGSPKLAYLSPTESLDNACYIPPQRTWVGLTDEEIKRLGDLDLDSNYFGLWYDFAKAIEAKLKEKNNG